MVIMNFEWKEMKTGFRFKSEILYTWEYFFYLLFDLQMSTSVYKWLFKKLYFLCPLNAYINEDIKYTVFQSAYAYLFRIVSNLTIFIWTYIFLLNVFKHDDAGLGS